MATHEKPQLPAANEFTVGQLGGASAIYWLTSLIALNGDRKIVLNAIRDKWFADSASSRTNLEERLAQQTKRAANVISGMRQYGLLGSSTDPIELSEIGHQVGAFSTSPEKGYEYFATFLLKERHGLELLQFAEAVRGRDGQVSKKAIDSELIARGYKVSTNSSYSGKLRQWLETAGVVNERWEVDEVRLAALVGNTFGGISEWRSLTPEQRAAVEVLKIRSSGSHTPIQSSDLLELLRQRGVEFDAGQVKKKLYEPLVNGGWITHQVLGGGRGGKGGMILPSEKSMNVNMDFIDGLMLGDIPVDLQMHLGKPTKEILDDLSSSHINTKGIALELLALRLASDMGLLPVSLRLRSSQTGGAEVDLVAEGAHLHFSRWLFQCKNQVSAVGLSVLAKEIGMATLMRAQIVVIVTTGPFASSVRAFARQASESTGIQVILLDHQSLANYKTRGPQALRAELYAASLATLGIKRNQVAAVPLGTELDES